MLWDIVLIVVVMVEGDYLVVVGQVGDLVCLGLDGVDEIVCQYNWIVVRWFEYLGV